MPEEKIPEKIEVDVPTDVPKSEIQFGSKLAFWHLPPARLKLIVRSIQGTFGGILTILGTTNWISGGQMKDISATFGIIAVVLEGLLKATGVVPVDDK